VFLVVTNVKHVIIMEYVQHVKKEGWRHQIVLVRMVLMIKKMKDNVKTVMVVVLLVILVQMQAYVKNHVLKVDIIIMVIVKS